MSRILAYTSPARGHLYPAVAVLHELARRGHETHVRTLAAEVPRVREAGVRAEPIAAAVEAIEQTDWTQRAGLRSLRRSVSVLAERAPHDAADLRAAIDDVGPDVVVVDVNAWGAMAAAEAWGGPWAAFCPYPLPIASLDAPPFGLGLPPARGALGRLRDRALRPVVLGAAEKAMAPALNAVRADVGVPPVATADDLFTRAPLLLAMTAEPLEYRRRDWPAAVQLVGPCAWEPPAGEPEWLASVEGPIVLVTTSSEFQDDGVLVRTALAALAGEPVTVVATVPSGDPSSFDVPANARVERFVPHAAVLRRAVCAITHGGLGATQKALAAGVPVVVVPFGRDQPEVGRRVAVAGAGVMLPVRRLTPRSLREAVRAARTMRDGAGRVRDGLAAAGGPARAADLLERLALVRSAAGTSP